MQFINLLFFSNHLIVTAYNGNNSKFCTVFFGPLGAPDYKAQYQ